MAAVALLQRKQGVLFRVSNPHQLAGELVCLAHRHGYPADLSEDPALVEAAVRPDDQPTEVLERLATAGHAALEWLNANAVPAGWQLLAAEYGPDQLVVLAAQGAALADPACITARS